MHQGFWHKCWEKQAIGFHQDDIHPFLTGELSALPVSTQEHVFVPLCGKSLDMLWWAQRGQVIGSELSDIACRDFFDENALDYSIADIGEFTHFQKENLAIFQGDFFALQPEQLPTFKYIYDRAALIALPSDMQAKYVQHLMRFLSDNTELYLIAIEFPQEEHQGPPFATSRQRVDALFSGLNVEEMAVREIQDKQFARRSLAVSFLIERLYRITRR